MSDAISQAETDMRKERERERKRMICIDPLRIDHAANYLLIKAPGSSIARQVELILEADDQWRWEHPPKLTYDDALKLGHMLAGDARSQEVFDLCYEIISRVNHQVLLDSSHPDGGGEEREPGPTLPEGVLPYESNGEAVFRIETGGVAAEDGAKYYDVIDLRNCSPEMLHGIADVMAYRAAQAERERDKENELVHAVADALGNGASTIKIISIVRAHDASLAAQSKGKQ